MCELQWVKVFEALGELMGDNSLGFREVLEGFDMGIEDAAIDELEDQAPLAVGVISTIKELGNHLGSAEGVNPNLRDDFFKIFWNILKNFFDEVSVGSIHTDSPGLPHTASSKKLHLLGASGEITAGCFDRVSELDNILLFVLTMFL